MTPLLWLGLSMAVQWQPGETAGPGITYRQGSDPAGPWVVHVIEFDPKTPGIDLIAARAKDSLTGKETVSSMARRHAAIAAVNAGYFVVAGPYAGAPVSAYMLAGQLLAGSADQVAVGIPGAPLSGNPERTALVLCDTPGEVERLEMDLVRFEGTVTASGASQPLRGLNRPRTADDFVLYTARIGGNTRTDKSGVEVALDASSRAVRMEMGFGSLAIPEGGRVLSASGSAADWLRAHVRLGDPVEVAYGTGRRQPSGACTAKDLVAAGPRLVRGGVIASGTEGFLHEQARHPRTAIGVTRAETILLVAVDGRQQASVGMTVEELARFMLDLGAVEAMNLDGGGSSTMVINGRVANSPSDRKEREVSDALLLVPRGARQSAP